MHNAEDLSDDSSSDTESSTSPQITSGLIPGVPRFFGCYLLVSEAPESKNRTYIGYTVNPVRRLRQHNGELKRGGAKRTTQHRPWRMVAVIHGFECRIQALAFEWAWTNPGRARSLAEYRKKRYLKTPSGQLATLGALCAARPWRTSPLTLTVMVGRGAWDALRGRAAFPDTLHVDFRAHGALGDLARYNFRAGCPASAPPREDAAQDCALCHAHVGPAAPQAVSQCAQCGLLCCLACFAECALSDAEDDRLVPETVLCPGCSAKSPWALVARLARALASERAAERGSGGGGAAAPGEETSQPSGAPEP